MCSTQQNRYGLGFALTQDKDDILVGCHLNFGDKSGEKRIRAA